MANKIMTMEDLAAIQEKTGQDNGKYRLNVMLCGGTGCHASGSQKLLQALRDELGKHDLLEEIKVVETGCNGFCAMGPVMTILPGHIFYQKVGPDDVPELVSSHLIEGKPVKRLMYHDPITGAILPSLEEIPFFALQTSHVLRNKGLIDPEKIDDYIWRDGYQAAYKSFAAMEPGQIIQEVKESGIRGRGGAGFPTGLKWEFCASAKSDIKYILCNADEGDPGAFMDRSVMEADPHSVLEGMLIGARAIGAHQGYIYCRAEYPLAVKRINIALEQARAYGLLGKDIFGGGFDFDIEVYQGAGAFVCGEETALMTSIEGKRGTPRPRPPFPAVSGLWQKSTVLNNVETWSNIPQIILNSGQTYASLGTDSSKGTKVFALTGKVNNIGLVEVPMGTSIGKIIFDIGGGVPKGKQFKAAQLGGPSGGCIPAEHLNLPTDYEAISKVGAIMGSGGLIVMDEDTCMVDMARYFMDFCQDESCGKCTPCRVGTKRMLEILERICHGQGRPEDLPLLETLSESIKDSALCGLGQTAPNPVLSTLRYFMDEYKAHIEEKRCPAGVCADLFQSVCQNACPVGMEIPAYIALLRAGRLEDAYKVLKRSNPFPSVCGRVCGNPCQSKCRRSQLDEPLAIKHLKRFITDYATPPTVTPLPVFRSEKIAVVGAGPAGLTAALELRKRGYPVTVFESLPEPGGMLRWGIPSYRLPRNVLAREINDIIDTGVELRTNTKIGRDISFADLTRQFDAIYLGVGAQASPALDIENDNAAGVYGAVEFLRDVNLGNKVEIGKRVAVIGGGNSAVDAARTAQRLGAESVNMIYRRDRKDMPAQEAEIIAAEQEGVTIQYFVNPVKVITKDNKVAGLELIRLKPGIFDRSGRKRPETIPDSQFRLEVDTVISAVGQKADLSFLPSESGVEIDRTLIDVDSSLRTGNAKVWAGGDVVTGPAMVIDAIAAGAKAAREIDKTLRAAKGEKPFEPVEEKIEIPFEVDEELVETPQPPMPELSPSKRRWGFMEVELGYTLDTAMAEARRCLRCDVKMDEQ